MQDFFLTLVEGTAKVLPVGFAARASFVGVVLIAVAGGFHESRNTVESTRIEAQLENIQKGQEELKEDLTKRLDRIEKNMDELLKERRNERQSTH